MRNCVKCGNSFTPTTSRQKYCSAACRKQSAKPKTTTSAQRHHLAERRVNLGHREVDDAPDRDPAVRLRLELTEDRRAGFSFDQVFLDEVDYVCSTISEVNDRRQWVTAFTWSKDRWRSAYDRTGPVAAPLSTDMLAA